MRVTDALERIIAGNAAIISRIDRFQRDAEMRLASQQRHSPESRADVTTGNLPSQDLQSAVQLTAAACAAALRLGGNPRFLAGRVLGLCEAHTLDDLRH